MPKRRFKPDIGRLRVIAVMPLVLVSGIAVASCVSPHNGLGTSSGTCFTALPAASRAVGNQGTLVGVRKFKAGSLKAKLDRAAVPGSTLPGLMAFRDSTSVESRREEESKLARALGAFGSNDVCAVAFQGSYSGSKVKGAIDDRQGRFAIVVVKPGGQGTVISVILEHLPFVFRHF